MTAPAPTLGEQIERLVKFNRRVQKIQRGDFFERVQRPWGVNTVTNTIEASQEDFAWSFAYDGPSESDITALATDVGFFSKGRDDVNLHDISRLYTFLDANGCISRDL